MKLNYFNYFTEIEDAFIRRRGKHLLLSPMDWALIESWKEMGVPLYVALRGIEKSFDSHEAKPRRRSVKTLMYCQEEVEAQYAEWLDAQLGAGPAETNGDGAKIVETPESEARLPFPRETILAHLKHSSAMLEEICGKQKGTGAHEFCDTLTRIVVQLKSLEKDFAKASRPNAEKLEDSLTSLEKMLDEALFKSLSPEKLSAARTETEAQLSAYRTRMEAATYQQTLDNLLLKRLRDESHIPRLSLFYL